MNTEKVSWAINKYVGFIRKNPKLASELEVALKWVSYFSAGHFSQAAVISELFHSSANLLTLLNDTILRKAANIPVHVDATIQKLHISLSVIEYVEVFIEVAARRLSGNKAKWLLIVIIQMTKCCLRLLLVAKNKQGMQKSPTISPLNRRSDVPQFYKQSDNKNVVSDPCSSEIPVTFSLRRSGRIVRSLEAAPPLSGRTWKLPLVKSVNMYSEIACNTTIELSHEELTAEILHIVRPLIHLSALGTFGEKSWKPWMLALCIDVISLHYLKGRKRMNHAERLEWSRRALNLLCYLMRSPLYNNFSKYLVLYILESVAQKVRGTGFILRPLIEYIPEWQKTYSYVWSI